MRRHPVLPSRWARTSRRCAGLLFAAALGVAPAAAPGQDAGSGENERYAMVPGGGGAVWRLDTRTGEMCVFEFTGSQPGGAVLAAGCATDAEGPGDGGLKRYAIGARSREQVWRLDSRTGRICVFAYRPVYAANPVIRLGCGVSPGHTGE